MNLIFRLSRNTLCPVIKNYTAYRDKAYQICYQALQVFSSAIDFIKFLKVFGHNMLHRCYPNNVKNHN